MKRKFLWVIVTVAILISIFVLTNRDYLRYQRARLFTGAAWDGNLAKMRLLFWLGADVQENAPGRGPAIVAAAWNGHTEIVEFLLDRGADVNARMKMNITPIGVASAFGHLETVRLLLSKGAVVNIVGEGGSPLHLAVENGHAEIADLLRKHGAKDCYEYQLNRCA